MDVIIIALVPAYAVRRRAPSSRAHLGTVKRVRDAAYVGHVSCRR